LQASRAALCTSGTAVMELTLAKLPCVVAYQAHFITEFLIHMKKKINFISLPNILLNSPVLPEILFQACTTKNLAEKLR
jgi:lipid-A-disaccharide synthase